MLRVSSFFSNAPCQATALPERTSGAAGEIEQRERRSSYRPQFSEGWRKLIPCRKPQQSICSDAQSNSSITVWTSPVNALLKASATLRILTEDDWKTLGSIRSHSDRNSAIAARILLRLALSQSVGRRVGPKDWQFGRTLYGKPFIINNQDDIDFSVAHVDSIVVVAIARGIKVGVDIESIDQSLDSKVIDNFCDANEIKRLDSLPEALRLRTFIQLWTKKEAYTKMIGLGHSIEFRSINLLEPPKAREDTDIIVEGFYAIIDHSLYHASLAIDSTRQSRSIDLSLINVTISAETPLAISPHCGSI